MKLRQAKKIMCGDTTIRDKYREKKPPYRELFNGEWRVIYPPLHDFDIIAKARKVFLHHNKKGLKKKNNPEPSLLL